MKIGETKEERNNEKNGGKKESKGEEQKMEGVGERKREGDLI